MLKNNAILNFYTTSSFLNVLLFPIHCIQGQRPGTLLVNFNISSERRTIHSKTKTEEERREEKKEGMTHHGSNFEC